MNARSYLLVANGEPVSRKRLDSLRRDQFLIALDGAANTLRRQKINPHLILGDFDSITAATTQFFTKKGVEFLHTPDQSSTDLEKGLLFCQEKGPESVAIVSALGGRTDQTLANLGFLKKFSEKNFPLALFSETERICYLKDQTLALRTRKGAPLAVLGFPKCVVSSKGLVYEMQNYALEIGLNNSVSNQAKKAEISLDIQGEALLIVKD